MFGAMLDTVVTVVLSAKTELLLFAVAFSIHYFLFGSSVTRGSAKSSCSRQAWVEGSGTKRRLGKDCETSPSPECGEPELPLQKSQAAYDRGDHRAVLRAWGGVKKGSLAPAWHLAQIVESMQRFKRDSAAIVGDVREHLQQNNEGCSATYINGLLEPLARSLDSEVVAGVIECLPSLGVKPNSATFEVLMQMHFSTRSFHSVLELFDDMKKRDVAPSVRTKIILLKTSLQLGHLMQALRFYKDVVASTAGRSTASSAPGHIASQLVELACREQRVEAVLEELDAGRMQLTTDMLNVLLGGAVQTKDAGMVARLDVLSARSGAAKNGRTFELLVRHAGDDRARIAGLLRELAAQSVECSQELVQTVLSVSLQARDVQLADQLCSLVVSSDQTGRSPAMLALLRFYSEIGQAERVCDLFDRHVKPCASVGRAAEGAAGEPAVRQRVLLDARTERCVVNAALRCGRQDIASQLLEATPADTAKHIAMIRGCVAKGNLDEAMRVFEALRETGVELPHSIWNTALDACVECRELRRAEGFMSQMQRAGVADVVSYNTLIKAHLRLDNFARARAMMASMRDAGLAPNHVTYNELIHAHVRSDSRRLQVWEVVDEMQQAGVKPNRVTCSILLKSLKAKSSHADVQRTMDLTNSMSEPLDEVLLSSVVEACVRVGKPALLSQKLAELQGKDAVAVTGAHTFGSLIKAYGYVKDVAGAWRCWKQMRSQHVKPTNITIGCMVEAVVTNGDIDGGYELMMGLLEDEVCRDQVNAVVFGSVLKGYGRAGHVERVFVVFKEMLSRGIEPSVITYNAVVDACARNGQMGKVSELLRDLRERGLHPNLITYSTMIKGYCQKGDMTAALSTLEQLRKARNLKPDEIVYNTILDGCAQHGLPAEGGRLFEEMQAEGVQPSGYTVAAMVKMMGQGRQLDRAFQMVREVSQKYRIKPNSHTHTALIQACLQCRDVPRAVGAWEHAVRERVQPDGRACMPLIRGLIAAGNHIQAASVLRTTVGLTGKADRHAAHPGAPVVDDRFVGDAISSLAAGGSAPLAASLLADFKRARPRARLDASVERRVAAAVASAAAAAA